MIYRINVKLYRLLHQFSRDCAATKPFDLDTVGLSYMNRAYELGKDAGRHRVDGIDRILTIRLNRTIAGTAARAVRDRNCKRPSRWKTMRTPSRRLMALWHRDRRVAHTVEAATDFDEWDDAIESLSDARACPKHLR